MKQTTMIYKGVTIQFYYRAGIVLKVKNRLFKADTLQGIKS